MANVKAKRKTVSAARIAKHWAKNKEPELDLELCDWGEPMCWGCGYFQNGPEIDYREEDKNPWECWNRAAKDFLEKCHIIPWAISGDDSLSNFVLLCSECHIESPDCFSVEQFGNWFNAKKEKRAETQWFCLSGASPELQKEFHEAEKKRSIYNLTTERLESVWKNMDDFLEWYGDNTVCHFGKKGGIGVDTKLAAMAEWCRLSEQIG